MGISFAWFKLAALTIAHTLGLSEREMPPPKYRYRCPTCGRKYETSNKALACEHTD